MVRRAFCKNAAFGRLGSIPRRSTTFNWAIGEDGVSHGVVASAPNGELVRIHYCPPVTFR